MRRLLMVPVLALAFAASACGDGYDTAQSACAAAGASVSKGPLNTGEGNEYALCSDSSYVENIDGDGDAWFIRGVGGGQPFQGDDDEYEEYDD